MKKDKDVPFDRIYVNSKFIDKSYTEIYVAPVDTSHLLKENLWELFCEAYLIPGDVQKNIDRTAEYMRNSYIKHLREDPCRHFTVVDRPGRDTLILEMSIVQLVPSKAALNLAQYFSWIPYAVALAAPIVFHSEDTGQGVIAMETRVRDSETGEVVAMFEDRQHPPLNLVSLPALFWWEPCKSIIDDWARQFVAMENGVKGKKNKEIPTFQIIVL